MGGETELAEEAKLELARAQRQRYRERWSEVGTQEPREELRSGKA